MINKEFWKNRRVLLTGHTGFKGAWLLLWLIELGADVYCYSLPPKGQNNLYEDLFCKNSNNKEFSEIFGDIRDFEKLSTFIKKANPEIVFHLAAQPLVRESYSNPLYTWDVNVQGSLKVLESLKDIENKCSVVMVTTDKVYLNKESIYGYTETDILGGIDPYSASKAAAEIAIASWRSSFCGNLIHQNRNLNISTARAGNVIGGGDWAIDRIFPDTVRALSQKKVIKIRNPLSKRPWQHVLEPLSGYIKLAEELQNSRDSICEAFNFGPLINSNRSVKNLVENILMHWPGSWETDLESDKFYESKLLHLQIDKSYQLLGWQPKWDFNETVRISVNWYKSFYEGYSSLEICLDDISKYQAK